LMNRNRRAESGKLSVSGGRPRWFRQQPATLVVADGFEVYAAELGQPADCQTLH
jgi:hypothetical protein